MLGRPVSLPDRPLRVVSLAPSLTEIVYAVGRGDWLVGVTEFCDFPPAARSKPKVGGVATPSLEQIVALRPDLVLTTAAGNSRDLLAYLTRLRVPVFALMPASLGGVVESIAAVGRALAAEAAAREAIGRLQGGMATVQDRVRGRARPRVLYLVWADPLIAAGPATYIHDLLALAGGENIVRERTVPYPRLNWEEVIGRRPEVILVAEHRDESKRLSAVERPAQPVWQAWQAVPAVRTGRVLAVPSNTILRPGPRIAEGLTLLARAIHPEAWSGGGAP
jgi:iron complex transport system substrate-binding protein